MSKFYIKYPAKTPKVSTNFWYSLLSCAFLEAISLTNHSLTALSTCKQNVNKNVMSPCTCVSLLVKKRNQGCQKLYVKISVVFLDIVRETYSLFIHVKCMFVVIYTSREPRWMALDGDPPTQWYKFSRSAKQIMYALTNRAVELSYVLVWYKVQHAVFSTNWRQKKWV